MKKLLSIKKRNQSGYALLEYCAGAAIVAGILWAALSTFGNSVGGLFDALSSWTNARTSEVQTY
ncbi:MAG: hypothetical protein KDD70_08200 [Bdellovibrionales bacterium]|nr:hypothetical protein [Bdellovibrionales bacterium]